MLIRVRHSARDDGRTDVTVEREGSNDQVLVVEHFESWAKTVTDEARMIGDEVYFDPPIGPLH